MSAALRHHKQQLLSISGRPQRVPVVGIHRDTTVTTTSTTTSDGTTFTKGDHHHHHHHPCDSNDDNDDMNTSSHCSLSDDHHSQEYSSQFNHTGSFMNQSSSSFTTATTTATPASSILQHPHGTVVKKYFHGHGWCMGEIVSLNKGKYKVRFDRPHAVTGNMTHKDLLYDVGEIPRLLKTAAVVPGTKLEIFWPQERRYYTATIKTEQPRKRENYLVCYDDERKKGTSSDREWIDLHRHKFRIVAQPRRDVVEPVNTVQNTDATPNTNTEQSHPKEVLIVQLQEPPHLTRDDSGSLSISKIVAQCVDEIASPIRPKYIKDPTSASTEYMHFVSDVPSNTNENYETATKDMALDTSEGGGTISSMEPRTIVSMEVDVTATKFESINGATHTFSSDQHDLCSPGSSSASTSRSIIHVAECHVHTPELEKSHVNSNTIELVEMNSQSNVTQQVVPIENNTQTPKMTKDLNSDNCFILEVESIHRPTAFIPEEDGDTDDIVTSKLFSNDDNDEEGIIIDPDNDETTKTAIYSLIQVGSRVAVYCENDDDFFPGTITDRSFRGKPFFLEYDDGDTMWIDLRKHRFRLLPSTSSVSENDVAALSSKGYRSTRRASGMNSSMDSKVQPVQPSDTTMSPLKSTEERMKKGSRRNQQNNTSMTPSKRSGRTTTKPVRLEGLRDTSDSDNDGQNVKIKERRVRTNDKSSQIDADIATITIGARVGVWWVSDQQYHNAIVTRERVHRKPYLIEYDDTEEVEWVDFKKNKFKIISAPTDATAISEREHRDQTPTKTNNTELTENTSMTERSPRRLGLDSPERNTRSTKEVDRTTCIDKSNQFDNDVTKITIGSHIAVWWGGDKQYYNAVVTRQRIHQKPFFIEYDDTDEVEWIDFRRNKFKILPAIDAKSPDDHKVSTPKKTDTPKRFRLGSPAKTDTTKPIYDKGVVNSTGGSGKKRKLDVIDEEKSPNDTNVDVLKDSANGSDDLYNVITVGSRVSVYWEGDSKYYDGVVSRQRKNSARKHYLEYDDGEASHWIDFREHWVRLLPKAKDAADTNVRVAKKPKVEKESTAVEELESKRQSSDKKNGHVTEIKESLAGNHQKAKKSIVVKNSKPKKKDVSVAKKANVTKISMGKNEKSDTTLEVDNVAVGTRVEVWWEGDSRYYKGTVIKIGPNQNKKYFVRYDDDEEAWVYFARNRVRLLKPTTVSNEKPPSKPTDEAVPRTRNTVKQKADKPDGKLVVDKKVNSTVTKSGRGVVNKVKKAAVTETRSTTKKAETKRTTKKAETKSTTKKATKIVESGSDSSDNDGDNSSSSTSSSQDHMAYTDFIFGTVENVTIGSRVSVWWSGNRRYYDGTITKRNTTSGCRRQFFIKYDDNDKEWTDLRRRYYRILE